MAIDSCSHSFSDMAQQILPDLMRKMRNRIQEPVPMSDYLKKGTKTHLKQHKFSSDFQGCYVLIEDRKPMYVGISRQVFRRLWYHNRGETHYTATLAYRIAAKGVEQKGSRNARMSDTAFTQLFKEARERINKCDVAFIEIDNDLTLYLFEAHCAMELDTCEWNTFRTH